MPELPPIVAKAQGEVTDVLMKMKVMQRAIEDTVKDINRKKIMLSVLGDFRSQQVRNEMRAGIQKMFDSLEPEKQGQSYAQKFWRGYLRETKKQRGIGGRWGEVIGWSMAGAPPVITGALGLAAGGGALGAGAAAGIGALALAAKEVLAPVTAAFQSIDQLATSGQISANASALRIYLSRGSKGLTPSRQKAFAALGGPLSFLMNPNVNWYSLTSRQQRALVIAAQHTTGMPTSESAQVRALMAERTAYRHLDPSQRRALFQYTRFDQALVGAQMKAEPAVMSVYGAGLGAITPLLKYLAPMANTAARALVPLIHEIGAGFKSPGFATFMGLLDKMAHLGIQTFGRSLINIGVGIGHIFSGVAKSRLPGQLAKDLITLTHAFAHATAGKGFSDFLRAMEKNGPVVAKILWDLVRILGELLKSMSSGFSAAMLKALQGILDVLVRLGKIPGVGPLIYNLIALHLILGKYTPFVFLLKQLWKGIIALFGPMVLAGIAGLRAKLELLWIGFRISLINITTWLGAMSKALWANLVAAAKWVAGIVARGAIALAAWVASMAGMVASTIAANAGIIAGTGGIALAIGLLVVGIYELVKHWKTVWAWIKRIAADAWNFIYNGFGKYLLPLLGPVGLIAFALIETWKVFHLSWTKIKNVVVGALKWIADAMLLWAKTTLRIAVDAFGWVPLIGDNLKKAQKAVDDFSRNVDNFLNRLVHPRTIPINIAMANTTSSPGLPQQQVRRRHALGTRGAAPGWAWVGEQGPELMRFRGGEDVLSSPASTGWIGFPRRGYAGGTGLDVAVHMPALHLIEQLIIRGVNAVLRGLTQALHSFTGAGGGGVAANIALGRRMAGAIGWGPFFPSLQALWNRESGWNQFARNPTSGAYGIPQALPGWKMASAGADWMTNPATQIRWGLGYIGGRYGNPAAAWAHETQFGWYGGGGYMRPGSYGVVGEYGPEVVRAGSQGATITPTGKLININVYTREIMPQYHAAQLGFELARRV